MQKEINIYTKLVQNLNFAIMDDNLFFKDRVPVPKPNMLVNQEKNIHNKQLFS